MSEINIYNPAGKLVATFPSDYTVRVSSPAPRHTPAPRYRRGGYAAFCTAAKALPSSPVPKCSVKEWLEHERAAPSNDRTDRIRTTHAYARYEEWAKGRAVKRAEFYRRMGSYGYNRGLIDGYSVYKISFYTDGDSFAAIKE
jgi:hypothetical protein